MNIISASRRTDIPAFYSEWFMKRIQQGYVRWKNPFSNAIYEVSLLPEDVSAIVFWSKNYLPLLPYLDKLDNYGYRMIFHFTITGLPKVFEPSVANTADMVECARILSRRYNNESVLWRYDPILISTETDERYHLKRFRELCAQLEGVVRRCYISFVCYYEKVTRNIETLAAKTGIKCLDLPKSDKIALANALADVADDYGIEMYSCCGDYLVGGKIKKAHCIDAELLRKLFPDKAFSLIERPTRKECGCYESKDIGRYNTCPHGCVYCYANSNKQAALRSFEAHNPESDML
ncbi:MAG: DUF1848 domain-containing protein, partial [Armatimonadota bacterium]|nr:DUF1848 domain-containing protein [Armatimonadota bacterium]